MMNFQVFYITYYANGKLPSSILLKKKDYFVL